jgi:hypothetical protein
MNPVDIFIDELPANKKAIADQLRLLIHAMVPGVQEKFSFKIPFTIILACTVISIR